MRILLTNDDGIGAPGLAALVAALAPRHELTVAAPAEEQSGMAHALTVHREMEVAPYGGFGGAAREAWRIDGTPTDCVKLYLEALAPREAWPELVLSGVNRGANLGTDVLYSGTVGGALEGYLHGLPSIAVSLDARAVMGFDGAAARFARCLSWFFDQAGAPFLFNVNFPAALRHEPPDFAWASLGCRDYANAFGRVERDGRVYYRVGGEIVDGANGPGTDIALAGRGFVTVTPLTADMTDAAALSARGRLAES